MKPGKLKLVTSENEWGRGLDAFRVRHGLSWRTMASICNGAISNRHLRRMAARDSSPPTRTVQRPLVIEALRTYLESKQTPPKQIALELGSIFCKEEIEPMITERRILEPEVQQFFRLSGDPFPNEPPRGPQERFITPQLKKIDAQLEDSINYQGFVAVIGPRGSGKSFLRRAIDHACDKSKGKMRLLWPDFPNMEAVHAASIVSFILREFGQKVPIDRVRRNKELKKLLADLSEQGVRVALGFDECHRLDPKLLTALKNFWEIGSGGYDRYLGLILFGQPPFKVTLVNSAFWEITERLNIINMPDMERYAWDYISHRLKLVNGTMDSLFEKTAVSSLVKLGATPLALGNLCNSALAEAYELRQRKVHLGVLVAAGLTDSKEPKVRAVAGRASLR